MPVAPDPEAHAFDLWVLVPAFNEAESISATLDALVRQSDQAFTLCVIDNGSTDATATLIEAFAARAPMPVVTLLEPEKGVGCAVDTGARYAIGAGARYLARTDAGTDPVGFRAAVVAASAFGAVRPRNRADGAGRYRMHGGFNMAMTTELYARCGGMPRQPSPTDRLFMVRVMQAGGRVRRVRSMRVGTSTRRFRALGVLGTARWYLDRGAPIEDPR